VLQQEKVALSAQLKKLTAERASLQEQLGSSAGDIDTLQVRPGSGGQRTGTHTGP
jgi:hypothetical protein